MKEQENEEPVKGGGQCSKDSDCGVGEVCVSGRCVPDITPPAIPAND